MVWEKKAACIIAKKKAECASRESNPGHKHGRLVCYRYTTGALASHTLLREFGEKVDKHEPLAYICKIAYLYVLDGRVGPRFAVF